MKKTISQRIHGALLKIYGIDPLNPDSPNDHIRAGWFSAGYMKGYRAATSQYAKRHVPGKHCGCIKCDPEEVQ